jgi:transposase
MSRSWNTREELVHQIVTLHRQGLAQRAITRTVGVSRNTVKAVLATHRRERDEPTCALAPPSCRAPRASKLDAFQSRVAELLGRFPGITAQRVFEILTSEGFDGGYTAVKKHVRRVRPKPKPAPSLQAPDWGPGVMAESDWSPYSIVFRSGERAVVQAFSYVLSFSNRKLVRLYLQSDLHALMDGHVRAFDRFDGCAERCTYDSQKAVVLRWEGQQPIYNPRFLAFAAHYEFRPRAVRGDPNAKPRVERGFWEVERSFLNGREFRDLDDMQEQLTDWFDRTVDLRRRHGKTALDRFAHERDLLLPLPRHPYDTARVVYRVCSIDGFVDWQGNRYAVPYDHITDILPVRITQRELFVYAADLRCVARHELAPRGAGQKVDPTGLHPRPQRQSPIDLDQLAVAFRAMGEGADKFFGLLSLGSLRIWPHSARRILLLRARYDTTDLDSALAHAARFGALDHHAV